VFDQVPYQLPRSHGVELVAGIAYPSTVSNQFLSIINALTRNFFYGLTVAY
jgi:hypothetical protein